MDNLTDSVKNIICREMQRVEMGSTIDWESPKVKQIGKPGVAEKAARNIILLCSHMEHLGKSPDISRDEYYCMEYINSFNIIPKSEEQAYRYNPKNPTHEKRLIKLLSLYSQNP